MTGRRARWLVAALCAAGALAAGCPSSSASLSVRVQSGLRAGDEVRRVDASLFAGTVSCEGAESRALRRDLSTGDQARLGDGTLTVGEYDGLPAGNYALLVTAYRPEGAGHAELISRCLAVTVRSNTVVRVPLTTDCLATTCPAPGGSPSFTECLAGRCVDPRCDLDDETTFEHCCDRAALGDACDEALTVCRGSIDCEETIPCAGIPRCADGVCVEPDEDRCPPGEYCSATTRDCEPSPASPDAGASDAALRSDAAADADFDAAAEDAGADGGSSPDAASGGCMGVCSPGQEDTSGCGNCGEQTRTCRADCTWGGWGGCSGEGPCAEGETDSQGCGCTGTQVRTCRSSCTWGAFGTCTGDRRCTDVLGGYKCPGETGTDDCPTTPGFYRRCTCSPTGSWTSCGTCFG